jgi:hypothetical protein
MPRNTPIITRNEALGERFKSARQLFIFSLNKLNTREKRIFQFIIGALYTTGGSPPTSSWSWRRIAAPIPGTAVSMESTLMPEVTNSNWGLVPAAPKREDGRRLTKPERRARQAQMALAVLEGFVGTRVGAAR